MIGGNKTATFQVKQTIKNAIGERVTTWVNVVTVKGFLDLSGGDSDYSLNAKVQESTHLFLCDYSALAGHGVTSENCRMICEDLMYNVMLIDDPMRKHEHLEIYLKYVGAGTGA